MAGTCPAPSAAGWGPTRAASGEPADHLAAPTPDLVGYGNQTGNVPGSSLPVRSAGPTLGSSGLGLNRLAPARLCHSVHHASNCAVATQPLPFDPSPEITVALGMPQSRGRRRRPKVALAHSGVK